MVRRRRAFICSHKDHQLEGGGQIKRIFLTPEDPDDFVPMCHGRKMERETNQKYRGKATPR